MNTGIASLNTFFIPDNTFLVSENAACNCSSTTALNLTVSDPPTQAEMQSIADVLGGLIAALKRPQ